MTEYGSAIKAKFSVRIPLWRSRSLTLLPLNRGNSMTLFKQADFEAFKDNMLGKLSKVEEDHASSLREQEATLEQERRNHNNVEAALKKDLQVSLGWRIDYVNAQLHLWRSQVLVLLYTLYTLIQALLTVSAMLLQTLKALHALQTATASSRSICRVAQGMHIKQCHILVLHHKCSVLQ